MSPCESKARSTMQLCYPPYYAEPRPGQYTCLHDATSTFDHEVNLEGQSDKQGYTSKDSTVLCERSSDQKELPLNCLVVKERVDVSVSKGPPRET